MEFCSSRVLSPFSLLTSDSPLLPLPPPLKYSPPSVCRTCPLGALNRFFLLDHYSLHTINRSIIGDLLLYLHRQRCFSLKKKRSLSQEETGTGFLNRPLPKYKYVIGPANPLLSTVLWSDLSTFANAKRNNTNVVNTQHRLNSEYKAGQTLPTCVRVLTWGLKTDLFLQYRCQVR